MTETTTIVGTKAKRGDLVAIVQRRSSVSVDHGYKSSTSVEVFEVIGITRAGLVRKVRDLKYGAEHELDRMLGVQARYVIPADSIDVPAAIAACEAHRWPGGQPFRPFDSVEELREILRPLRTYGEVER